MKSLCLVLVSWCGFFTACAQVSGFAYVGLCRNFFLGSRYVVPQSSLANLPIQNIDSRRWRSQVNDSFSWCMGLGVEIRVAPRWDLVLAIEVTDRNLRYEFDPDTISHYDMPFYKIIDHEVLFQIPVLAMYRLGDWRSGLGVTKLVIQRKLHESHLIDGDIKTDYQRWHWVDDFTPRLWIDFAPHPALTVYGGLDLSQKNRLNNYRTLHPRTGVTIRPQQF